jgi:hypothetical protein
MRPWLERFKRWFFQRYKFTKQSVFWTLLCIVLFGLSLYFMVGAPDVSIGESTDHRARQASYGRGTNV